MVDSLSDCFAIPFHLYLISQSLITVLASVQPTERLPQLVPVPTVINTNTSPHQSHNRSTTPTSMERINGTVTDRNLYCYHTAHLECFCADC